MAYSGKATTVGNSKALSFEASLFKAHPEFAAGRMEAHVIAPGTMLVTSTEHANAQADDDEDPVMLAFLAFLEKEMIRHPELIQPLDENLLARIDKLVGHIEVDLDEDLGEDAWLP
jgi:antitoxin PrlF